MSSMPSNAKTISDILHVPHLSEPHSAREGTPSTADARLVKLYALQAQALQTGPQSLHDGLPAQPKTAPACSQPASCPLQAPRAAFLMTFRLMHTVLQPGTCHCDGTEDLFHAIKHMRSSPNKHIGPRHLQRRYSYFIQELWQPEHTLVSKTG